MTGNGPGEHCGCVCVRCSSIVGEVATDPPREASIKELTLLLL